MDEIALEKRVADLEAQVRALTSLVLSDIISTRDDGCRDIGDLFVNADREAAAAAKSATPKAALFLGDMIGDLRDVFDMPDPTIDE